MWRLEDEVIQEDKLDGVMRKALLKSLYGHLHMNAYVEKSALYAFLSQVHKVLKINQSRRRMNHFSINCETNDCSALSRSSCFSEMNFLM